MGESLVEFHWEQHSDLFLTFNFCSQLLWIWFQLCSCCHLTLKEKPHGFCSSSINLETCMGIHLAPKCWEHPAHVRLRDKAVSKEMFTCSTSLITLTEQILVQTWSRSQFLVWYCTEKCFVCLVFFVNIVFNISSMSRWKPISLILPFVGLCFPLFLHLARMQVKSSFASEEKKIGGEFMPFLL